MLNSKIVIDDINELIVHNDYLDYYKNKSILITGGTGLISSYLIAYFNILNNDYDANIELIINVRSKDKFTKRMGVSEDKFSIIEKSVQDIVIEDITSKKIDYIFHLAGSSSPFAIQHNPTDIIKANIEGTIAILEIAKLKKSKVFFSSTREVYGETIGKTLLSENDIGIIDQLKERSCYPESKRMAENIFVSYKKQFNVEFVISRIAHLYGPGMSLNDDGRIMSDLISKVSNNKDIELISDGSALRAFCYVTDALNAILLTTVKGQNEVFNISNEREEISILELSRLLVSIDSDKKLQVKFSKPTEEQVKGYLNITRVGLDTSKLENLKWSPQVGLYEGLSRTLDSFK